MDARMDQQQTRSNQVVETHSKSSDLPQTSEVAFGVSSQMTSTRQWYHSVTVEEQETEAVSLSDQFRYELEQMRKVMASIMKSLESMMIEGCSCHLDQVQDIYDMPVDRTNSGEFVSWEYTETQTATYEESEQTVVSADGIIKTADNREIDFTFDFEMARSFLREDSYVWTESGYAFVDPLVIRTDVSAPLLSGARFSFDLDLDGEMEDLPMPGPGMGFLALDLNEDGIINDGSELFGPSTGFGFEELAAYDLDNNDWIDENDDIFDQLILWESAESGMQLTRIKEAGIGAIYLAGVESSFDLTTDENELWARVGKTSIALTEEGDVLPVQELDYTV